MNNHSWMVTFLNDDACGRQDGLSLQQTKKYERKLYKKYFTDYLLLKSLEGDFYFVLLKNWLH